MTATKKNPLARLFGDVVAEKHLVAQARLLATPKAEIDAAFTVFREDARALESSTLRERLDRFRDHLGAEHFSLVASGPSLQPLLEEWLVRQRSLVGEAAVDRILTLAEAHRIEGDPPLGRPEAAAYFAVELERRGV